MRSSFRLASRRIVEHVCLQKLLNFFKCSVYLENFCYSHDRFSTSFSLLFLFVFLGRKDRDEEEEREARGPKDPDDEVEILSS